MAYIIIRVFFFILALFQLEGLVSEKGCVSTKPGRIVESGSAGHLKFPDTDEKYDSNITCYWRIVAPENTPLHYRFLHFDLEKPDYYLYDYLHLYYTYDQFQYAEYVREFHGDLPPTEGEWNTATGNELYLKFVSDRTVHYGGFFIEWIAEDCVSTKPGRVIEARITDHLKFPAFYKVYESDRTCYWKIVAPQDQTLHYHFTHFDLEEPDYYLYDHVNVYYTYDQLEYSEYTGHLHGGVNLTEDDWFATTGNELYVAFVSDRTVVKDGFVIEWRVEGENSGWSEWSDWSTCTVEGSIGKQTRRRICTNPASANGSTCVGESVGTRLCNLRPIPVYPFNLMKKLPPPRPKESGRRRKRSLRLRPRKSQAAAAGDSSSGLPVL